MTYKYRKTSNGENAAVGALGCLFVLIPIVLTLVLTAATVGVSVWAIVWVLQAMGVI